MEAPLVHKQSSLLGRLSHGWLFDARGFWCGSNCCPMTRTTPWWRCHLLGWGGDHLAIEGRRCHSVLAAHRSRAYGHSRPSGKDGRYELQITSQHFMVFNDNYISTVLSFMVFNDNYKLSIPSFQPHVNSAFSLEECANTHTKKSNSEPQWTAFF